MESTLARRIKHWRRRAGLTQRELAELVGVGQPSVSAWEAATHSPSAGNIEAIARACGAVDAAGHANLVAFYAEPIPAAA